MVFVSWVFLFRLFVISSNFIPFSSSFEFLFSSSSFCPLVLHALLSPFFYSIVFSLFFWSALLSFLRFPLLLVSFVLFLFLFVCVCVCVCVCLRPREKNKCSLLQLSSPFLRHPLSSFARKSIRFCVCAKFVLVFLFLLCNHRSNSSWGK